VANAYCEALRIYSLVFPLEDNEPYKDMENSIIRVLTDDVDPKPILDFEFYSNIINNIIVGSDPKFSIGIYGDWGTGKTTLMRLVERKLKNNGILTVWFDAWRYEREDEFVIVPLLKTIIHRIKDERTYDELKPLLFRATIIIGKDILRKLAEKYVLTDKGIDELEKEYFHKFEELERDTLYYDAINKINDKMQEILHKNNFSSKVVVFIDDLDRCTPTKVLEVFESIKVFLGIEGFVYILGLSRTTVSKAIEKVYQDYGIMGDDYIKKIIQIPITIPDWNSFDIEALIEDLLSKSKLDLKYHSIIKKNKSLIARAVELNPRELKRFINSFIVGYEMLSYNTDIRSEQPLFSWNFIESKDAENLRKFLKEKWNLEWTETAQIKKTADGNAIEISSEQGELVTIVLNPEKTKAKMIIRKRTGLDRLNDERLTYEFIVTEDDDKVDVYPKLELKAEDLVVVQALRLRWENFYKYFSTDSVIRKHVRQYLGLTRNERLSKFAEEKKNLSKEYEDIMNSFLSEPGYLQLWKFLKEEQDTIFKIENWEIYRRAAQTAEEIHLEKPGSGTTSPSSASMDQEVYQNAIEEQRIVENDTFGISNPFRYFRRGHYYPVTNPEILITLSKYADIFGQKTVEQEEKFKLLAEVLAAISPEGKSLLEQKGSWIEDLSIEAKVAKEQMHFLNPMLSLAYVIQHKEMRFDAYDGMLAISRFLTTFGQKTVEQEEKFKLLAEVLAAISPKSELLLEQKGLGIEKLSLELQDIRTKLEQLRKLIPPEGQADYIKDLPRAGIV
jgi:GTPase SAR1 family protein